MKVIFCYANEPNPIAAKAIRLYAPEAEFIETSGLFGYNTAIASNWGKDDLVVIEGDKEITEEVIPSFSSCDEPWCIYEYWNFPAPHQQNIIYGLGCTKYSLNTQRQIDVSDFDCPDPEWLSTCKYCSGAGCWSYLDTRITIQILNRCISFAPHTHGRINHHHEYPADWAKQRGLE